MTEKFRPIRFIAFCAVLCAFTGAADAAEIKLIASNAVKEAYGQLLPAYEKASGNKVTVSWSGTADIIKRVNGGEVADAVIITDVGIDGLIKQGKLTGAGRINVAKSAAGVAVRAGAPKPDISSTEALKKSVLAAKGIVLTPGPSNPFLHQLFDKMGIGAETKAKEVQPAQGRQLTDPIVQGRADLVFSQISELIAVKGVAYAGPLPKGSEIVLTYAVAYHAAAPNPEAAKALMKFLTSPDAVKVLKENGLEPG
jgi:molybdate transport system substrate-binding protein